MVQYPRWSASTALFFRARGFHHLEVSIDCHDRKYAMWAVM